MTRLVQILRSCSLALIAWSALLVAISTTAASAHQGHGHAAHHAAAASPQPDRVEPTAPQHFAASRDGNELPPTETGGAFAQLDAEATATLYWTAAHTGPCEGSCQTMCGSSVCHCLQGALFERPDLKSPRSTERHDLISVPPLASRIVAALERPPKV
jgi:hypothetical protein